MKYLGQPQSGSIAAQTASRNRYGQYFRDRVMPDQTSTVRRAAARAHMATVTAAWSGTLTEDQRTSWRAFAPRYPITDSLGQVHKLSGQQAFCRHNLLVFANSSPTIQTDPPLVTPFTGDVVGTGVWQTSPYVGLEFTWPLGEVPTFIEWFQSANPVSAGTVFFPGRGNWWRRCWGASAGGGTSVFAQVIGIFSGQRVAMRWRQYGGMYLPGPWQQGAWVRP